MQHIHLPVAFTSCAWLLLTTGCTAPALLPETLTPESSCRRLLEKVDDVIVRAGVADAGLSRIEGYPQLRADRFLASFAFDRPVGGTYRFWLENMEKRGNEARRLEMQNLSTGELGQIRQLFSSGSEPTAILETCARQLTREDLNAPQRRSELLNRVHVPDSYDGASRVLGLYALTKIPFLEGVAGLHGELRATFAMAPAKPSKRSRIIRYSPPAGIPMARKQIAAILETAAQNPLRMPTLAPDDINHLFDAFAPVWEIESADDNDRIGALRWGGDGKATVDITSPTVYRLASHTRYGDRVLLQLNYLIWFPARAPDGAMDIYAGPLDGIIWRVTLSPDGEPLAYDSIHPCGCYYQIFPGPGFRVVQPKDGSEPVLSPLPIATIPAGQRLTIRLAARTHFIQQVYAAEPRIEMTRYIWGNYTELLSSSLSDALGQRSLFNEEGLTEGSERTERFLFWPMGVASAGAMRQWGTHAIAFVGRRHFDDARLLDGLLRPLD